MATFYTALPDDLQDKVKQHIYDLLSQSPYHLLPRVGDIVRIFGTEDEIEFMNHRLFPKLVAEVTSCAQTPSGRILKVTTSEPWMHDTLQQHPHVYYNPIQDWYILLGIHDPSRAVHGLKSLLGRSLVDAASEVRLEGYRDPRRRGFCYQFFASEVKSVKK